MLKLFQIQLCYGVNDSHFSYMSINSDEHIKYIDNFINLSLQIEIMVYSCPSNFFSDNKLKMLSAVFVKLW